jgi:hypothetical protein
LRQAAEQASVSKSTISRAIQKGRLSADRTDSGGYLIDPSELLRVYPIASTQRISNDAMGQDAMPNDADLLRVEIEGLKAQLALVQNQVEDVKSQRDEWAEQAKATQRLLADQRPASRKWFGFK